MVKYVKALRNEALSLQPYLAESDKFKEGWDLHRRDYPYTVLSASEAKKGWLIREQHWRDERLGSGLELKAVPTTHQDNPDRRPPSATHDFRR